MVEAWKIVVAVVFAMASALFSGLTLGLMTHDASLLRILIEASRATEEEFQRLNKEARVWRHRLPIAAAVDSSCSDNLPSILMTSSAAPISVSPSVTVSPPMSLVPEVMPELNLNEVHFAPNLRALETPKKIDDKAALAEKTLRLDHLRLVRRNAKFATRILDIRFDTNMLLVTLLVCNVAANSGFSILMSDLTSSLVGFLISTTVILVFGEILPQAVCMVGHNGLFMGYYCTPIIQVLEMILYCICKPIALLLDVMLGESRGSLPTKDDLKVIIEVMRAEGNKSGLRMLEAQEGDVLRNVLGFSVLTARAAYIPLEETFCLPSENVYNISVLQEVLAAGYSRIPVVHVCSGRVVGLLYMKDLLGIPVDRGVQLRELVTLCDRPLLEVDESEKLSVIFKWLRSGGHMAVVRNGKRHLGIVTLQDVTEKLLGAVITEEFEAARNINHVAFRREDMTMKMHRHLRQRITALRPAPAAAMLFGVRALGRSVFSEMESPGRRSSEEMEAISVFLRYHEPRIFDSYGERLENMICREAKFIRNCYRGCAPAAGPVCGDEHGRMLATPDSPSEWLILVLCGSIKLSIDDGSGGCLNVRYHSWTLWGVAAVFNIGWHPNHWLYLDDYESTEVMLLPVSKIMLT